MRAFPSGEGNGDAGWLVQAEVRYAMGDFMPYVFHDNGRVTTNARASRFLPAVTDNHRSVAGGGMGVRYVRDVWNADVNISWRTQGGKPQTSVLSTAYGANGALQYGVYNGVDVRADVGVGIVGRVDGDGDGAGVAGGVGHG